jgi:hypothetical protein
MRSCVTHGAQSPIQPHASPVIQARLTNAGHLRQANPAAQRAPIRIPSFAGTHWMKAGATAAGAGPRRSREVKAPVTKDGVGQANAPGAGDRRRKRRSHLGKIARAVQSGARAINSTGPLGHDSRDLSLLPSLLRLIEASQHLSTIRAHGSVPVLSPSRRASNNAHECTGYDLRVRAKGSTLHIE